MLITLVNRACMFALLLSLHAWQPYVSILTCIYVANNIKYMQLKSFHLCSPQAACMGVKVLYFLYLAVNAYHCTILPLYVHGTERSYSLNNEFSKTFLI